MTRSANTPLHQRGPYIRRHFTNQGLSLQTTNHFTMSMARAAKREREREIDRERERERERDRERERERDRKRESANHIDGEGGVVDQVGDHLLASKGPLQQTPLYKPRTKTTSPCRWRGRRRQSQRAR